MSRKQSRKGNNGRIRTPHRFNGSDTATSALVVLQLLPLVLRDPVFLLILKAVPWVFERILPSFHLRRERRRFSDPLVQPHRQQQQQQQ
jgi:hypothetical protein